jgi:hypothetical protein
MTWIEFTETIRTVCTYYERKIPNDNAIELWHERVKTIPRESLDWIKRKIFEENDTFPKNLPTVMWSLYNAWLTAHPEKRAFKESVFCPDCEGGWLALQKQVDGYRQPISFSAPCGKCRQIPSAHYMTLFQAIEQGYERIELKKYPEAGPRDIKKLAESVGMKMPDYARRVA